MIRVLIYFIFSSLLLSCAVIKSLEGGPKDEKPPVFLSAKPDRLSTRVDTNLKEVRIYFDEHIKPLKDTYTQVMISPPQKRPPIFSPRNLPRKYIGVKFQDPLEQNTTYIINFGESIQDNTEGNKLPFLTYVFSTGETLDSIKVTGKVSDAYEQKVEKDIIVGLYKADSSFNDSIIFNEKPYYSTKADKDGNYQISHIKEGKYMMIAFNDALSNQIYNPQKEKLGFISTSIDLKKNENFNLRLSKETPPLKVLSPKQTGWRSITFPFEGPLKDVQIKPLQEVERELFITATSGDSIDYWYKPIENAEQETKSLLFEIIQKNPLPIQKEEPENKKYLKKKDEEIPSSYPEDPNTSKTDISPKEENPTSIKKDQFPKKVEVSIRQEKTREFLLERVKGHIVPNESIWFESEAPIFAIDTTKIKIKGKDSMLIPFQVIRDSLQVKKFALDFSKEFEGKYKVFFETAAIEDILGNKNDEMVTFSLKLGKERFYNNLEINLHDLPEHPFQLQLLNENAKTVEEFYGKKKKYMLCHLAPGKYSLRLIVDENEDKVWNPGDFKLRRQPEPVYFYNKTIEIREFMDIRENWTIPKKYDTLSKSENNKT
ncbi:MAG: Ig-like domain-containing domain [Flavobacteriales bacterium Tduv]